MEADGGGAGSPSKHAVVLKKWLDRRQQMHSRLIGKVVEASHRGKVAGAILSFLGKATGFAAEHTWAFLFCCRTYWCKVDAVGIEEGRWN